MLRGLRDSSATIAISLSPVETVELLSFLQNLTQQLQAEPDIDGLRRAYEKLDEAEAVAAWLGEDLRAELTPAEGCELSEAISVRMEEDLRLEEISKTLTHVRRQVDAWLRSPAVPAPA